MKLFSLLLGAALVSGAAAACATCQPASAERALPLTCTSNTVALTCPPGSVLAGETATPQCIKCVVGTKTCSKPATATDVTAAKTTSLTCMATFHLVPAAGGNTAVCTACANNCATCTVASKAASKCLTCLSGFGGVLASGVRPCAACAGASAALGGLTCTGVTDKMTKCKAGAFLAVSAGGVCAACTLVTTAADCGAGAEPATILEACPAGSTANTGTSVGGTAADRKASKGCKACAVGKFAGAAGVCTASCHASCQSCTAAAADKCILCNAGYYGGGSAATPAACPACVVGTLCGADQAAAWAAGLLIQSKELACPKATAITVAPVKAAFCKATAGVTAYTSATKVKTCDSESTTAPYKLVDGPAGKCAANEFGTLAPVKICELQCLDKKEAAGACACGTAMCKAKDTCDATANKCTATEAAKKSPASTVQASALLSAAALLVAMRQ